jgi:hypothetical protein
MEVIICLWRNLVSPGGKRGYISIRGRWELIGWDSLSGAVEPCCDVGD